MNVLEKYEFETQTELLAKIQEVIKEKIESVKKLNLAYKTSKNQNKYILEVLVLDD